MRVLVKRGIFTQKQFLDRSKVVNQKRRSRLPETAR
jgi:hypothetical protein